MVILITIQLVPRGDGVQVRDVFNVYSRTISNSTAGQGGGVAIVSGYSIENFNMVNDKMAQNTANTFLGLYVLMIVTLICQIVSLVKIKYL